MSGSQDPAPTDASDPPPVEVAALGASTAPDLSPPEPAPSRTGRLLGVLRKLIDYGKEIAATLRRGVPTEVAAVTRRFGTGDLHLIVGRILRALHIANDLQASVLKRVARRQAAAEAPDAAPQAPPCAAPPMADAAANSEAQHDQVADPGLPQLPTTRKIVAKLRQGPAGIVIGNICRNLGIGPGHELWPEIAAVMAENGGAILAARFTELVRSFEARLTGSLAICPQEPVVYQPAAEACATGPP